MAESFLKYRTCFTSSLKNELVPLFDQLAKKTRIPKSRLLDEVIEDLLIKYKNELPTEDTIDRFVSCVLYFIIIQRTGLFSINCYVAIVLQSTILITAFFLCALKDFLRVFTC